MTNQQQQELSNTAAIITSQEETLSSIEAMCHQESRSYECGDYLQRQVQAGTMTREEAATCINNRLKMVQWCMALVDACQLSRETVSATMSCLDRYLDTKEGSYACVNNSETFQLAAMASFYSMQKISGGPVVSPDMLARISKGFYSAKDLEDMEWEILSAVQWRVNAPTSLAFVREFLQLVPRGFLTEDTREQVYGLAKLQTEMAVGDYTFATVKASSIAAAAILNAFEALELDQNIVHNFIFSPLVVTMISIHEVSEIRGLLFVAIASFSMGAAIFSGDDKSDKKLSNNDNSSAPRRRSYNISPRTVCNQAA